ncbi:hypothetical protein Vadar_010167 [Vaccinium darrowii]|uniref:Uncharacterized protein n=1 Tax=Vaccinium darrowii TaxID=229202 RepID=A0ACB7ZIA4_9ERIC|nr:hypothetical protein Vadar_010167 [Vaccinium darrowii]
MARKKGLGKPSTKLTKRRRQNSDSESSSEEYDPTREEGLKADAGTSRGDKGPSKRTHDEVVDDKREKWLAAFKTKKVKCERRVTANELGEKYGVPEIRQEGLRQWFDPVPGYNLKCVKEFYMNAEVVKEGEGKEAKPVRLTAKMANKVVKVTPDRIAKQLKYKRPDPSTVNYPGKVEIDEKGLKETLFKDPQTGMNPIIPSRFNDEIRIINKAIHANLYPKGKETKPSDKSAELLGIFMDPEVKVDWAHFIFLQMVEYLDTQAGPTLMWFPCLITKLCHDQGVKGPGYTKLEPREGGVIDTTTLKRSKAQSKGKVVKVPKAAPSSTPGASSSTVPPPLPKPKSKLLVPPPDSAKPTVWYKKLFKLVASGCKKIDKIERKQKADRHYRDWEQKVLENLSGQHYEVPPELVVEDSDEDEEKEDDSDEEE